MQIAENTVVSIHYKLKNKQGETLDSSDGGEPLAYLHGAGNIIPGLENELSGKQVGDKLEVEINPDLAYGERQPELIQNVPIKHFKDIDSLEVGMRLRAESDTGEHIVTITEITENEVAVDANHPLAGETLFFSVTVVEVREATQDELEHRHVHHGECGHSH